MHDESLFAERSIRAGALGFVNQQQAPEQLVEAIDHVIQGKLYLSPEVTERMICRSIDSENYSDQSPIESLSDRETIKHKLNLDNATELTRPAIQWVPKNE